MVLVLVCGWCGICDDETTVTGYTGHYVCQVCREKKQTSLSYFLGKSYDPQSQHTMNHVQRQMAKWKMLGYSTWFPMPQDLLSKHGPLRYYLGASSAWQCLLQFGSLWFIPLQDSLSHLFVHSLPSHVEMTQVKELSFSAREKQLQLQLWNEKGWYTLCIDTNTYSQDWSWKKQIQIPSKDTVATPTWDLHGCVWEKKPNQNTSLHWINHNHHHLVSCVHETPCADLLVLNKVLTCEREIESGKQLSMRIVLDHPL
jgi:hypothetical protein